MNIRVLLVLVLLVTGVVAPANKKHKKALKAAPSNKKLKPTPKCNKNNKNGKSQTGNAKLLNQKDEKKEEKKEDEQLTMDEWQKLPLKERRKAWNKLEKSEKTKIKDSAGRLEVRERSEKECYPNVGVKDQEKVWVKAPKGNQMLQRETRFVDESYRFRHRAGTSTKDSAERACIAIVGENKKLFDGEGEEGPQRSIGKNNELSATVCKSGTQEGETPRYMKYSVGRRKIKPNFAGAHVELQRWTETDKNGKKTKPAYCADKHVHWEDEGNWILPLTQASNSQGGRTPNTQGPWMTLGYGITAIKIPG